MSRRRTARLRRAVDVEALRVRSANAKIVRWWHRGCIELHQTTTTNSTTTHSATTNSTTTTSSLTTAVAIGALGRTRRRRKSAAVCLQRLWRGHSEREFGPLFWRRKRLLEIRAKASFIVGKALRRLLGRVRRRFERERRRREVRC